MKKILSIFVYLVVLYNLAQAQSIKGVINRYTRVMVADTCSAKLTVKEINDFQVGEKVLIIQMNGASMQQRNNASFGDIIDLRNTGKYEINEIDSMAGKEVYLKYSLTASYAVELGFVQMVSFPTYIDVVISDTLKALPWDGEIGGILAFDAQSITMNAPIDVSGLGFRGGTVKSYKDCEWFDNVGDQYYDINSTNNSNGGRKGEGIALIIAGKECGKGPQTNGGGGGNNHKIGGGGGGHMTPGGRGGINDWKAIGGCNGDDPGIGGKPILGCPDCIFFGGGGGSGHNKEGSDSKGGNGGGVVIIKAKRIIGNGKKIMANGTNANTSEGDGGGGGGAGGTIIVLSEQYSSTLNLEAKGGNGGNAKGILTYNFGPGGGGSGGRIIVLNNTSSVTSMVTGGLPGRNLSSNNSQGATTGELGHIQTANFNLNIANKTLNRTFGITVQPKPELVCEGKNTKFTVSATGLSLVYQWEINKDDGKGFIPLSNDTVYSGVNDATLSIKNANVSLNPYSYRCAVSSNCATIKPIYSNEVDVDVKQEPLAIFSYSIAANTVTFTNGSANANKNIWTFGDGKLDSIVNPVHEYPRLGVYNVKLSISNECGAKEYSQVINLYKKPSAGFTANSSDFCNPANVQFRDSSSNNVVEYLWSFPGGTPSVSTAQHPRVSYNTPGDYDVTMIVINPAGSDTMIRRNFVHVTGKPTSKFSYTISGVNVTFTNQSKDATDYTWDFGDGGTSNLVSPQYTFKSAGTYAVKLTSRNSCDSSIEIKILNIFGSVQAVVSVDQTKGCSPFTVQYNAQNIGDATSVNWTFPGGSPAVSTLPNPRVTYNLPGTYNVTLSVVKPTGTFTTRLDTFIKAVQPPRALFEFVSNKDTVRVTNRSSFSIKYKWDFGDGTTSLLPSPPPHTYKQNGNYNITLLAENEYCGSATSRQVPIFFTAVKDLTTEGGVTITPNPTNGMIYMSFKDIPTVDYNLIVLRPDGQVLKTVKLNRESLQELSVNELSNGVYILQFTHQNYRFIRKVVKI
jgi:PKD repeat protein